MHLLLNKRLLLSLPWTTLYLDSCFWSGSTNCSWNESSADWLKTGVVIFIFSPSEFCPNKYLQRKTSCPRGWTLRKSKKQPLWQENNHYLDSKSRVICSGGFLVTHPATALKPLLPTIWSTGVSATRNCSYCLTWPPTHTKYTAWMGYARKAFSPFQSFWKSLKINVRLWYR